MLSPKGEKQLFIVNGEGEFDKKVFVVGNNFKTKYQQLLKAYNGGQCVTITLKRN